MLIIVLFQSCKFNDKSSTYQSFSETFLKYADDIIGLAHRVEMYCRDSIGNQVLALHCAPFGSDIVCRSLIVTCLFHRFCKFQRNVK